jgi:hypothetical protein
MVRGVLMAWFEAGRRERSKIMVVRRVDAQSLDLAMRSMCAPVKVVKLSV